MSQGAWVLVAALVLATAFGLVRALRDGRFRGTHGLANLLPSTAPSADPVTGSASIPEPARVLGGLDGLDGVGSGRLGERATLLQFSSAFCAPCRVTRRVLAEVADLVPGVTHLEVDAEDRLDLVRRLDIVRTPTTLVLDAGGRELSRASGAPRRDEVLAALDAALGGRSSI